MLSDFQSVFLISDTSVEPFRCDVRNLSSNSLGGTIPSELGLNSIVNL